MKIKAGIYQGDEFPVGLDKPRGGVVSSERETMKLFPGTKMTAHENDNIAGFQGGNGSGSCSAGESPSCVGYDTGAAMGNGVAPVELTKERTYFLHTAGVPAGRETRIMNSFSHPFHCAMTKGKKPE